MKNLTLSAVAAAFVTLAASQAALAQEAVPPNHWTSSGAVAAQPAVAASPVTREAVRDTLAAGRPSPFADSPPGRGSMHRPLASKVSRAEIQADLQIWRESGLATLEGGEAVPYESAAYRAAQARHAALRDSPYYASLVQRYGSERGDRVAMTAR